MKQRCSNEKKDKYSNYGGAGIEVKLSFDEFLEEVGLRPGNDYSIDRIDPKGHYEKGNIRWATQKEQCNNKSNNRLITYLEETKTEKQWAEYLRIPYHIVHRRARDGWCPNHLFNTPKRYPKPKDCPHCETGIV